MKLTKKDYIVIYILAIISIFTILSYVNSFKVLGYVSLNEYKLEERIDKILDNYSWDERIE